MVIVAVDDDKIALTQLVTCIRNVEPKARVQAFGSAAECLAYAQDHAIDVVFAEIQMIGMNGLDLGKRLMEMQPRLNVIYCTTSKDKIKEAFCSVRCNGYIIKPVEEKKIQEEILHLRVPLSAKRDGLQIQCFGRFEVLYNGKPVKFENEKTKELLAFLVNRHGIISRNQEIIEYLWDDDFSHDSYFKKIRKDLLETLDGLGYSSLILRQRGGLGIDVEKVQCDFYEWKQNHAEHYEGEYMTQYYWANILKYE